MGRKTRSKKSANNSVGSRLLDLILLFLNLCNFIGFGITYVFRLTFLFLKKSAIVFKTFIVFLQKKIKFASIFLFNSVKRVQAASYNLTKSLFISTKKKVIRTSNKIIAKSRRISKKALKTSHLLVTKLKKTKFPKIVFPKIEIPKLKTPKAKKVKVSVLVIGKKEEATALNRRVVGGFVMGTVAAMLVIYYAQSYLATVSDPKKLSDFQMPAATQIYDRNNTLLYTAYDQSLRVPVPLSKIPKNLIQATIAAEDKRFYSHHGFDLLAILRAVVYRVSGGETTGASTLTQQLAKNVFLTNERTLSRKVKEAVISARIEQNFTKNQILELYFNTVSYGGVVNGVEAASQRYFGKHAYQLTDKEAVFLASLPVAPSIYSQIEGDSLVHPKRMTYVLDNMVEQGFISSEKKKKIEGEKLEFVPTVSYKRAPHAVDYVLHELENKYGRDFALQKGLVVHTSIDLPLQNYIQESVLEQISSYRDRNLTNAAVVVTNPKDESILAMVGSVNYYDEDGGQFNVATAPRQLGSSVKIITYAAALEKGYSPSSTIVDAPIVFKDYNNFKPRNYDGKFHGTVTLTGALANSYNIPALKLAYNLGINNVAALGAKMGISEFERYETGEAPLSMAIGGVEISLTHLAKAYGVLANDGRADNISMIDEIRDYSGNVLYKKEHKIQPQIVSEKTADNLFSMLSNAGARSAAFGSPAFFNFGANQVAIKTGTSNDVKDNVAVAFSKDFVVAVWVGNNDGRPMYNIMSGYSGASSIMHMAASKVLDEYIPSGRLTSITTK